MRPPRRCNSGSPRVHPPADSPETTERLSGGRAGQLNAREFVIQRVFFVGDIVRVDVLAGADVRPRPSNRLPVANHFERHGQLRERRAYGQPAQAVRSGCQFRRPGLSGRAARAPVRSLRYQPYSGESPNYRPLEPWQSRKGSWDHQRYPIAAIAQTASW